MKRLFKMMNVILISGLFYSQWSEAEWDPKQGVGASLTFQGVTNSRQCRKIENRWSALRKSIFSQYQECLCPQKFEGARRLCSKKACKKLHIKVQTFRKLVSIEKREKQYQGCLDQADAYQSSMESFEKISRHYTKKIRDESELKKLELKED